MSSVDRTSFSTIKYLPTTEAYDRWADVYDTDGNFLQAIDDVELKTLFPRFVDSIQSPKPWRMVDLGCGTGRNTALLLTVAGADITALDASPRMLDVARSRMGKKTKEEGHKGQSETTAAPSDPTASSLLSTQQSRSSSHFEIFDLLTTPTAPPRTQNADAIISTLVLEHVPLAIFFSHVSQMLRPGGVLLLTNMHAHMGGISQAGFVDVKTGEKIRPKSYAHTIEDTVREAERWGFLVEGPGVKEVAVEAGMVEVLGPRSAKWVGVTCWFGGLFRKAVGWDG